MRKYSFSFCFAGLLACAAALPAQPPFPGGRAQRGGSTAEGFVSRMMAFDENHDGKLSRSEITDERLLGLFDRADENHDGVVTKEELIGLYTRESAAFASGPHGGPGMGGPGMRPQPGQILNEMTQRMLNLTPAQKSALSDLQREVDRKLDQLLTTEQKAQLREMAERGPGGFGARGDFMPRPPGPH